MPYETLWGPVSYDRQEMLNFLKGHFRYDTLNSWNRSTSYAVNVKVSHLDLTKEQRDACYELLDVPGSWDVSCYNERLREFDCSWSHSWQIGTNGRSGGYLVLYQGGQKPSGYKQVCGDCGQRSASMDVKVCGGCHATNMQPYKGFEVFCYSGRGTDGDVDFEEWDDEQLDSRYELVKDFDKACAEAVKFFVAYAMDTRVVEKTIMVPTKVKVAVPRRKRKVG